MLKYFASEQQKERCIRALELSIDMWKRMTPVRYMKRDRLAEMRKDGTIPKDSDPENYCFLCQYVKEETFSPENKDDIPTYCLHSGLNCTDFCPVCWDKKYNPENQEKDDTICQMYGTSYDHYRQAVGWDQKETALRDMISLLEQSLEQVKQMPINRKEGTLC